MKSNALPDTNDIIRWIIDLPADSPELAAVARIRRGESPDSSAERLMTLTEIAKTVGLDKSWLHRLGIQKACGHRFAGSLRYRESEVLKWLGEGCHPPERPKVAK